MFEPFIISDHIIQRYIERVGCKRKEVINRIRRDLHFTNANRIINIGNDRHVFTRGNKEFIFKKLNDAWILKTIIRHNRQKSQKAIEKRLRQKEQLS